MLHPTILPLAKGFDPQIMTQVLFSTSAKAKLPKVAIPFKR
jgi:hypothetical protein